MLIWKDPKTGLEWQAESPGKMNWHEAIRYAKELTLDGKKDWRLPTARELETLIDRNILHSALRPVMRAGVPFKDDRSYWTATTFEDHTNNAWIVMFDGGYVLSYYKRNAYYVRCVRR